MSLAKLFAGLSLSAALGISAQAQAYEWTALATIGSIDVTNLPAKFRFTTTAPVGTCPAGTYLVWGGVGPDAASREANVKAVFATLMSAKVTAMPIRLNGRDSGCTLSSILLE